MSRMFGCICNQPNRLAEALAPVRATLVAPPRTKAWGLGYVQGGQVLLQHHPRVTDGVDFYEAIRGVASDYIIGHATVDSPLSGNENTQPFRYRKWLFAMTGEIDRFDDVRGPLTEHVPEFIRRSIKGKTSAEYLFHLFLAFLHDAGALDDPNVPLATTRRALRDAVAMASSLLQRAGGGAPGNIVLSNGRCMMAARLAGPLHVRRFKTRAVRETKEFRAVLAVSEPDQLGEGFEELPERSVLAITRDLQVDIVDLEA